MTVTIHDEQEFAKAIQDVLDTVDCLKEECLPTERSGFEQLEKQSLKLLELVERAGKSPDEAIHQATKKYEGVIPWPA